MSIRDCLKASGRAISLSLGLMAMGPVPLNAQELAPIGLVKSERLRLMAYGEALRGGGPQQIVGPLQSEMSSQGYYHAGPGVSITRKSLQLTPMLGWDGNINGGVLRDRFALNNGIFVSTPDSRAKSGVVLGGTFAGQLRSSWDEGRLFEFQAVNEIGYAPRHNLWRSDLALSACSRNHVKGWTFLDLCALGFRSWRALSNNDSYRVFLRASHLVSVVSAQHEVGLGLEQASSTARPQTRMSFGLESLWPNAVSEMRVTLGRPVEGATVLRERLELGMSGPVSGRGWSADLWLQRSQGGSFLGWPRRDEAWGVGLSTSLSKGFVVRFGYSDNYSTAPIATYSQVSVDLKFKALNW